MTRRSRVGFAMLLCASPATARAQEAAPPPAPQKATPNLERPAAAAQPAEPPVRPPGTYPPPPPRWADQPPMEYPFPTVTGQAPAPVPPAATTTGAAQAEDEGVFRRFSFTAAVGPGALIGPGEN